MSWLEVISQIVRIISGLAIPILAFLVFKFNQRINKALVVTSSWSGAQQRNLAAVQNPDVLEAIELVNVGAEGSSLTEEKIRRAIYLIFVDLNRLNALWMARESGVFTKGAIDPEIEASLSSLLGQRELLEHCLKRGYSDEFQNFLRERLEKVEKEIGPVEGHQKIIGKLLNKHFSPQPD